MDFVEFIIKWKNFWALVWRPRRFLHYRWADILKDTSWSIYHFAQKQYFRVYIRFDSKYRFHPQQMYHNSPRRIDPDEALANDMSLNGTYEYYRALPSSDHVPSKNYEAHMLMHNDSRTLTGFVNSVRGLCDQTSQNSNFAFETVLRGLTRPINIRDDSDWRLLRLQLRTFYLNPDPDLPFDQNVHGTDNVLPIAISHKAENETFISKISLRKLDGHMDDAFEELEETLKLRRGRDFLDDRRWDQLKRCTRSYASEHNMEKVCFWLDRLVPDEVFKKLTWAEFGLYPYMLMPTIRVYEQNEPSYSTSFWRKVETTLAISGKGLVCDDYMIRKYDTSIYYDHTLYRRLRNGALVLGGNYRYVRSTVLAFATMISSDGICITKSNEHEQTKSDMKKWKSWALRCISEEAFAATPAVPIDNERLEINPSSFRMLVSWEYDLCKCNRLLGNSYINMSHERSSMFSRVSSWNGVTEWIGMHPGAVTMTDADRLTMLRNLNEMVSAEIFVAPSGHTVALLTARNDKQETVKSLVVDLGRFSTQDEGHVVAVAESTCFRADPIVPWYVKLVPNPDEDQQVLIENHELSYEYKTMKAVIHFPWYVRLALWIVVHIIGFATLRLYWFIAVFIHVFITALLLSPFLSPWPWIDENDVGEALFDNVLLHSLYESGIKSCYRKLVCGNYAELKWE